MKKVLMSMLMGVCLIGISQAQSPSADYQGRHGMDIYEALHHKSFVGIDKAVNKQATLSALDVGGYLFTLQDEKEEAYDYGRTKKVYTYYPQNGPAKFRETISIDIHTNEATIIREAAATNRMIGPLSWRHEDYEISSIEVTVYPYDILYYEAFRWAGQVGADCVLHYSKFPHITHFDYLKMQHTPMAAFRTADNHTVQVVAKASSAEFGDYRRECREKAPGILYKKFMNMVEQLKKDLDR